MTDKATYQRVQALREGGHTKRVHTIPHHGENRVDSHTWQLVTLLYLLMPEPGPSPRLVKAAHFHDVGERYVGDLPGHAKYWHSPELGAKHKEVEAHVNDKLGVNFEDDPFLSAYEIMWLKGCDLLEFFLWCEDQKALGNMHIEHMRLNVPRWIEENPDKVPDEIAEFIQGYSWERTHDNGYWNFD